MFRYFHMIVISSIVPIVVIIMNWVYLTMLIIIMISIYKCPWKSCQMSIITIIYFIPSSLFIRMRLFPLTRCLFILVIRPESITFTGCHSLQGCFTLLLLMKLIELCLKFRAITHFIFLITCHIDIVLIIHS